MKDIFVLFDIWCWHLCCGCFLKIFRTNISTYVNFSWRHYDRLQWGWWHFVAGIQVIHLFLHASGWRKFGVAFGRSSFSANCKLMFIFIISVCHLMKPWWYWHSFSSLGMWVSRVGCGGMYVRHQAFTPFAVCWRALTIHVKCFLDECAIQMKLLMSIDHLCQMLFRRIWHSKKLLM